ncbi:putative tyrosine-protein kinase [Nymphaea thermarum]|nr:putative tyrosine-protein kinase [Nymphaea thermarum]
MNKLVPWKQPFVWCNPIHKKFKSPKYFTQNTSLPFTNTLDSNLFQTARLSPVSLRYYGLGLENGNYRVNLLFAETAFPDTPTWQMEHRNLVKLLGCCLEGDKRLLVYEYMENKSLDQSLFGNKGLNLNWSTRFHILLGTARGLAYLHEGSRIKIVHRDVKASNILLDAELNPKISDFGMAKLYDDDKSHLSTRVAGTVGYLAPEYAMRGHLTEKVDVFGFGVLALEVISGRPNADNTLDPKEIYLLEWAWHLHEHDSHLKLVDPTLTEYDEEEALRVIRVALLCTQASPSLRPRMSRVIAMLSRDIEVDAATSRPAYLTDWQFKDISSTINTDTSTSKMSATTATDDHQSAPTTTCTMTPGSHSQ